MSTYLELTNELLRRTLETELTSSSFASTKATQATAKDCIRAAVNEILNREDQWPFYYNEGSQTLTIGQSEYNLPAGSDKVDWESFRVRANTGQGVSTIPLKEISRDRWQQYYKSLDEDAGSTGLRVPQFVFPTNYDGSLSFGVSPSPDQAYVIDFDYYTYQTELSLYSDTCIIPERFNYVIINMALKHWYMFKDNAEQGNLWLSESERSLNQMRNKLVPKRDNVSDTRVNFGGIFRGSSYFGG